jgi:hypothetical protein
MKAYDSASSNAPTMDTTLTRQKQRMEKDISELAFGVVKRKP